MANGAEYYFTIVNCRSRLAGWGGLKFSRTTGFRLGTFPLLEPEESGFLGEPRRKNGCHCGGGPALIEKNGESSAFLFPNRLPRDRPLRGSEGRFNKSLPLQGIYQFAVRAFPAGPIRFRPAAVGFRGWRCYNVDRF